MAIKGMLVPLLLERVVQKTTVGSLSFVIWSKYLELEVISNLKPMDLGFFANGLGPVG